MEKDFASLPLQFFPLNKEVLSVSVNDDDLF